MLVLEACELEARAAGLASGRHFHAHVQHERDSRQRPAGARIACGMAQVRAGAAAAAGRRRARGALRDSAHHSDRATERAASHVLVERVAAALDAAVEGARQPERCGGLGGLFRRRGLAAPAEREARRLLGQGTRPLLRSCSACPL